MSAVTRRGVLKGAATAVAVAAVPAGASAVGLKRVVIYDSRLPASLAFCRTTPAALAIDLAEAQSDRFASLRRGLPRGMSVEALTRRGDMVALRSELARHGLRQSGTPRYGALVRWSMVPR
ncbi:MAG: hypothetical protein ACKOPE_03990 [Novosphingobium sp.]